MNLEQTIKSTSLTSNKYRQRGKYTYPRISQKDVLLIKNLIEIHVSEKLVSVLAKIDNIIKRLELIETKIQTKVENPDSWKEALDKQYYVKYLTSHRKKSTKKTGKSQLPKKDELMNCEDLGDLQDLQITQPNDQLSFQNEIPLNKQPTEISQFKIPLPRGNNTSFNPATFSPKPPMQNILPQYREDWQKLYLRVTKLVNSKKQKNERGWYDYQKRMILDFVTKGAKYGCNPYQLTIQLGISNSTFKRWRNYFK